MYSFDFFQYVIDKHNNVWKYVKGKDHFIKVTPWESNEDRRVNRFEIEKLINEGKLTQMKAKPKLFEIINKRWQDDQRSWEFNGQIFQTNIYHKDDDCMKAPLHVFTEPYEDKYRIAYHNGKLVWFTCYHYYPQALIFDFVSVDQRPTDQVMWTKVTHLKPVYNATKNQYI